MSASTAPSITGIAPIIQSSSPATNAARAPKKAMALASTAARYGSRLSRTRRRDDERIRGKHCIKRRRHRQEPRPGGPQVAPRLPLEHRDPRGHDRADRDKRPAMIAP